ncbi:MAG: alpha-galactosidase [Eubacteriales bacterium]|nr:alpha-galactosidase [Eubacteriales bacterium]
MVVLKAHIESDKPFHCDKISFEFKYSVPGADFSECLVPGGNMSCGIAGMKKLKDYRKTPEDVRFCGLLNGSDKPCLLFGTVIPCNMILKYSAALVEKDTVSFTATNYFTSSLSDKYTLDTEAISIITGLKPIDAMNMYAELLPKIECAEPLIGWSTWDYYFTAYDSGNVLENIEAIKENPVLSDKIKYIFLDDGWQHREGEWFANYRFPEGTKGLAEKITENGFIPGIWTNGCQVYFLTHTGLRKPEIFLKDERGNAITFEDRLIIDPTHPEGEAYIYETYKRLKEDGYKAFKVDFVSTILYAAQFYDTECGPYGAIRRLFSIIRKAVGDDSHIIGCSYPGDCGPGFADSCRIAVDIHNHWEHVLWILEYLQVSFWENERLYRIDPDFFVVRGRDTSKEKETNVFNPFPNPEYRENAPSNRWRKGDVFTREEAETWANIVQFCAGNIVLGDRISMLNDVGMELTETHIVPNKKTAVPLDLGEGYHAGLWYTKEDARCLVINIEDKAMTKELCLDRYGIETPDGISVNKPYSYENGVIYIELKPHESAVISFLS